MVGCSRRVKEQPSQWMRAGKQESSEDVAQREHDVPVRQEQHRVSAGIAHVPGGRYAPGQAPHGRRPARGGTAARTRPRAGAALATARQNRACREAQDIVVRQPAASQPVGSLVQSAQLAGTLCQQQTTPAGKGHCLAGSQGQGLPVRDHEQHALLQALICHGAGEQPPAGRVKVVQVLCRQRGHLGELWVGPACGRGSDADSTRAGTSRRPRQGGMFPGCVSAGCSVAPPREGDRAPCTPGQTACMRRGRAPARAPSTRMRGP